MPGVAARSVTAAVGTPPTQKNASIFRSLIALTDSAAPRRSCLMSFLGSMPTASSTRSAMTSTPLPGEPVDTRLPLRSASLVMPVPSTVTICMRFGYSTISVRALTFASLNLSMPCAASHAASTIENATSDLPAPMSFRLSTEPPVTSAVACRPGMYLERMLAIPPPSG